MVFVAALITTSLWAQMTEVAPVDTKALKAKLEKAKEDTNHPKKGTKAATWMKYATAVSNAYYANTRALYVGQEEAKVVEAMKAPLNATAIPIEDLNGKKYKVYKYENVDVYIDATDNKVGIFIDKNPIAPNLLSEYERALLKTLSLDAKQAEKVIPMLGTIVNSHHIDMQNHLAFKRNGEAIAAAVRAAELQKNPALKGVNDKYIESYYYASVCAIQGELFSEAKKYLEILIAEGDLREGEVQYYLGYCESKLGNTDRAKKVYEEAIAKFPGNQNVMESLIQIYIETKEDPSKVIPYIKQAQKGDPNKAALYVAEGVAYEKMGQINKSIEAYEVAVKKDPTNFVAYYNLGYNYSLLADKVVGEINEHISKKRNTDIESLYKKLNDTKKKALPYLTKAHELNKTNRDTVTLLKQIYFSLREESAEMMSNFEKFSALEKSL